MELTQNAILHIVLVLAVLAVLGPSLLRRWRGLPLLQPLHRSDIWFFIVVTLVCCALAFVGASKGLLWLTPLSIMLPPFLLVIRMNCRRDAPKVPTYNIVVGLALLVFLGIYLMANTLVPAARPVPARMLPPQQPPIAVPLRDGKGDGKGDITDYRRRKRRTEKQTEKGRRKRGYY